MPMVDMVQTGKNIKQFMVDNHMNVKDMQNVFGFNTPTAIYKWMRGACLPTIDNVVMMASIFNVRIDDIIATIVV